MTAALLSTLAQLASAMDPTGPRGTPPLARTSTDASQQRRPGFGGSSYPALRRYASVDSMVQGGATTYIYGHQSFIGSGTSPPLPVDELGDEDHAEPGSSTAFTVREVRGEVDSFSERFCWYTTAEQRYWESVHMTIEHVLPRNQRKSSAWNGGGMEATGDADDDHMDSTSTQFKVHRITRPFHPDLRPDSVHEENFRGNVQDPVASSITFLRHPDRNEVLNVRRLSKERDVVNNPMTEILTTGSTYKLEFCQRFHVGSRPGGETSGTSNGGNAVKSARLRWWERAPLQVWLREMHSELGDQNIGMLQPNRASRIWLLDTIHPHKLQSTVRPGQRVDGEPVDIHHQWSGDVDARPSVDKLIRIFERPQHVPAWLRDLMITPFTVHNYEVRDRRSRLMAWVRRAGYRCFESEVEIPYDAPTDRHYEFVVSGPDRDANGERIILGTRGPSSFWIEDEAGRLWCVAICCVVLNTIVHSVTQEPLTTTMISTMTTTRMKVESLTMPRRRRPWQRSWPIMRRH